MEETFLYSVNPRKVITGLKGINNIRTPKSLYLTKEDVLVCLKNASVYRRFSGENVRVTIDSVDRLHREEFISEEDWPEFLANEISKDHGTVKAPVEEPKKAEEPAPAPEPKKEKKEEKKVEAPVAPVVEEAKKEEEVVEEAIEEVEVESDDEEVENA